MRKNKLKFVLIPLIILSLLFHLTEVNIAPNNSYYNTRSFQPSGWSKDFRISERDNDYWCVYPHIASNEQYVHILWTANRNSTDAHKGLCYRRSVDGGNSWENITYLTYPYWSNTNDIAVSSSNVHIIYFSDRPNTTGIEYRRSTDNGKTWGPIITNIVEFGGTSLNIEVFKNNIHICFAYRNETNEIWGIVYLRSTDNGNTWDESRFLMKSTGITTYLWPRLEVNGYNIFIVYWGINDTIELLSSHDNGNIWDHKIIYNGPFVGYPQIAGEKNHVGVVWINKSLINFQLQFMKSDDYGNTWSEPRIINDSFKNTDAYEPCLIFINNTYHLVWEDYRDCLYESDKVYTEIYYKSGFNAGDNWTKDIRLTKKKIKGPISGIPSISISGNNKYVCWEDDRTDRSQIFFKRTLPDYIIDNLTIIYPKKVWANSSIFMNLFLKNIGYADGYYVNVSVEYLNKQIFNGQIKNINLNETKKISFHWVPKYSGYNNLKLTIDKDNDNQEWNENNNEFTKEFFIKENNAPITNLKIDKIQGKVFENITLDASNSYDPDGVIETYYFDFGDGNNSGWIKESTVIYNYSQPGHYKVELIVQDDRGAENSITTEQDITIIWHESPPVINEVIFFPINPVCNENVSILVDAFDLNNDDLDYLYISDNGTIFGNGKNVTWRAPKLQGKYRIIIRVFDGKFYSLEWLLGITANKNHEPVIEEIYVSSNWISPGESVNITINATDEDGHILFYDFYSEKGKIIKNNSNMTWQSPKEDGVYLIDINISDNHSGFANEEIFIIVGDPTPDSLIKSFTITPDIIYKKENTEILIELEIDEKYINLLYAINVNLTLFNKNRFQQLFDTSENGDEIANDGIYSYQLKVNIKDLTGEQRVWANVKTKIPDFELNTSTIVKIENKSKNHTDSLFGIYFGSAIISLIIFIIILTLFVKRKNKREKHQSKNENATEIKKINTISFENLGKKK